MKIYFYLLLISVSWSSYSAEAETLSEKPSNALRLVDAQASIDSQLKILNDEKEELAHQCQKNTKKSNNAAHCFASLAICTDIHQTLKKHINNNAQHLTYKAITQARVYAKKDALMLVRTAREELKQVNQNTAYANNVKKLISSIEQDYIPAFLQHIENNESTFKELLKNRFRSQKHHQSFDRTKEGEQ